MVPLSVSFLALSSLEVSGRLREGFWCMPFESSSSLLGVPKYLVSQLPHSRIADRLAGLRTDGYFTYSAACCSL